MLRLFRHYIAVQALSLALLETTLFFVLLHGILMLWQRWRGPQAEAPELLYVVLAVSAFIGMAAVGLYNRDIFYHLRRAMGRFVLGFTVTASLALSLLFLFSLAYGAGYEHLYLLTLAGTAAFVPLALLVRKVFLSVAAFDAFKRRVVVVGTGPRAAKIAALPGEGTRFGIVAYIRCGNEQPAGEFGPILPGDMLCDADRLGNFVRDHHIAEIVVATRDRRGLPVAPLFQCMLGGTRVTDYANFWERETGELDLEELQPSWLVFSDGFRIGWARRVSQRLFDIVIGLVLLVVTLPITITTAVAIKLDSPGPVFFRQERVGRNGQVFNVIKFRSMTVDAEKDGVARWATASDPRVTRIGAIIRRSRIDEIPQVLNVLAGEMSIVGPRPERPVFVAALRRAIPYYDERHRVKPGITGWAQVNFPYGASEEDARRKLAFDLYFLKNGSLFLDLIVLLQTVRVVLLKEGAR